MRNALTLTLALLLIAVPAAAHHGWSSYDGNDPLTLTGTILEASYTYPHGTIMLETPDKTWLAVLAPPGALRAADPAKAQARPNILFILADDLGWSDLGCYGADLHETPHLELLARLFERIDPQELVVWIAAEPTGQYARRAGFLYEFLMQRELEIDAEIAGERLGQRHPK